MTHLQILRIARLVRVFVVSCDQEGRVGEQVIHLLERQPRRLGKEQVEGERVGEVADYEEVVVSVSHVRHGDVGDLADEGVECCEGVGLVFFASRGLRMLKG